MLDIAVAQCNHEDTWTLPPVLGHAQEERQSPPPYVTVQEMHLFLAIIVQMGHDLREMPKD